MGFRDDGEAMLARIRALEIDLASTRLVAQRVTQLESANQDLRAELAEYKARARYYSDPGSGRTLTFRIREPGAAWREETFSQSVIKIGKLSSSHIKVDDEAASRLHAVIEVSEAKVVIVDLGSAAGTRINGKKISRAKLKHGDQIRVGNTEIIIGMY